ncbi:FtsX-like permease family protein [Chitinophaga niastensis]|uniref:FtsX-like permease family protein n=1 Tax=Chitinophaga niastensis TaxID=536980 RepID=A0A2P8HCG4_CHINA|nr:FtsX-like permease family protein [Chitinophaga niastensis]PSL43926.1 FtsX-like permease family protein [Chitinophaga niastensis]
MLISNIKITFRHLLQNKLYSSINVIGLAIGISCMLLAVLYWKDERSFDTFHQQNPHLYRITTTLMEHKGDKMHKEGGTGQVQGPAFKAGIPEIVNYTRILGGDISGDVVANDKALRLQLLFVDDSFFNTFSFQLLRGNPQTVLTDIGSAVITESTAMRYFNSIDVVGKLLQLEADPSAKRLGKPMVITGVVKDPPEHSSIRFDVLLPFTFLQLSFTDNNWLDAYLGTYITLRRDANVKAVTQKMAAIFALHAKEQLAENIKRYGFEPGVQYDLQPMTDIHLEPLGKSVGNTESGITNGSSPLYAYMFIGIAVFILLMAGINFVNISLAASLNRAKEVGVRKLIGSSRFQIISQFLGESALLCMIAFLMAVVIAYVSLPVFNRLTGKHILLHESIDVTLLVYLVIILTTITLLTGLYPAKVLSNFKPGAVLYNTPKLSGRSSFGRSLVVVQFSLAVFMLVATLVYYRQMDFMHTKDLGYNPNGVILTFIGGDREVKPVRDYFRNELSREPAVKMVSFGGDRVGSSDVKLKDRTIPAVHKVIDENYLPEMEIPLKAGRNFSAAFPTDKNSAVIVNEAFVKAAGLENPIGAQVKTDEYFDKALKTIVGVAKDFHVGSLREPIQPMVMFMSDWYGGAVLVKFEKAKQKEAMAALQNIYTKMLPQTAYQYVFLDERNAKAYLREEQWQQVIYVATMLSVVICTLGLFGLAHLSTRQRIKEIGVRKILGASVRQIIMLLAGDFLKMVLLSFVIAAPFAWLAMNKWLQDFAYRITIGPGVFILAGLIAIVTAFMAVSVQSIIAATANPVKSLRAE